MTNLLSRSNKGKPVNGANTDDEENEGLALLIPDIQETAKIVHVSTDRLKIAEGMSIMKMLSCYLTKYIVTE